MGEINNKLSKITSINFSITKCPHKVYERFINFAKSETSDNYSMALKMLLDGLDANIKEVHLYEQYMGLKLEVEELKELVENLRGTETKEESTKPKTFGEKKKEKEEKESKKN